ncbi:MAG TPA: hypothetical protein VM094_03925, partial [Gemmatimonadales bacterium]|nr:hypothetical protein [Gemmatimonadales bacterium]
KSREVELIMLVKQLLYTEKFTIDGARQRIDQYRRTGELRASARKAFEAELAGEARAAVEAVIAILDGKTPESSPAPPQAAAPAGRSGGKK